MQRDRTSPSTFPLLMLGPGRRRVRFAAWFLFFLLRLFSTCVTQDQVEPALLRASNAVVRTSELESTDPGSFAGSPNSNFFLTFYS